MSREERRDLDVYDFLLQLDDFPEHLAACVLGVRFVEPDMMLVDVIRNEPLVADLVLELPDLWLMPRLEVMSVVVTVPKTPPPPAQEGAWRKPSPLLLENYDSEEREV